MLLGSLFTEQAQRLFAQVQALIIEDFGWFYILPVAGFLLFVLFLMISRYGDVKLGPDDSEPDYSYMSWLAMLFSAGMGIGLVFFGAAEPIQHYASPPVGEGRTVESARQAMSLTFLHRGLHAWAICIVVGLALAYFAFRRGLPLTPSSALFPRSASASTAQVPDRKRGGDYPHPMAWDDARSLVLRRQGLRRSGWGASRAHARSDRSPPHIPARVIAGEIAEERQQRGRGSLIRSGCGLSAPGHYET